MAAAPSPTLTGKVVKWNAERGFGFITCEGHPDIFVHASQINKPIQTLTANENVTYHTYWDENHGKYTACNVVSNGYDGEPAKSSGKGKGKGKGKGSFNNWNNYYQQPSPEMLMGLGFKLGLQKAMESLNKQDSWSNWDSSKWNRNNWKNTNNQWNKWEKPKADEQSTSSQPSASTKPSTTDLPKATTPEPVPLKTPPMSPRGRSESPKRHAYGWPDPPRRSQSPKRQKVKSAPPTPRPQSPRSPRVAETSNGVQTPISTEAQQQQEARRISTSTGDWRYVLGLQKTANVDDARKKFYQLSKLLHPDKVPEDCKQKKMFVDSYHRVREAWDHAQKFAPKAKGKK